MLDWLWVPEAYQVGIIIADGFKKEKDREREVIGVGSASLKLLYSIVFDV